MPRPASIPMLGRSGKTPAAHAKHAHIFFFLLGYIVRAITAPRRRRGPKDPTFRLKLGGYAPAILINLCDIAKPWKQTDAVGAYE